MTCSVDGCQRPRSAKGLCKRHYERTRLAGRPRPPCNIDGCGKPAKALGWCSAHYARWLKHGTTDDRVRVPDLDRYLSKCAPPDEKGCRIWVGGVDKDGYGKFSTYLDGHQTHWRAHRYGYTTLVGAIPDGLAVCHSCDVPRCQAPEHWWLGSNQDNTADKTVKARAWKPRGRQVAGCKLSPEQVREIRAILSGGDVALRDIAHRFGVSKGAIDGIAYGRTWAWLT